LRSDQQREEATWANRNEGVLSKLMEECDPVAQW
jgi:hypothetical protein